MSMPLKAAFIPAESPSNTTVILFVSLLISLIWSELKAVPDEETTLRIPLSYILITSVYPSTKKQLSCFAISCLA